MRIAIWMLWIAIGAPAILPAADPVRVAFKEHDIRPTERDRRRQRHIYESVLFSPGSNRLAVNVQVRKSQLALRSQAEMEIIDLSEKGEKPTLLSLGGIDSSDFYRRVYYCYGAKIADSYSSDGSRLLTLVPRWEPAVPNLTVRDLLRGEVYRTLRYEEPVTIQQFAFSADHRSFAIAGAQHRDERGLGYVPGQVCVWNLDNGELRFRHREEDTGFMSITFSPKGDLVAAGGGEWHDARESGRVVLFDGLTGEVRHTLRGHQSVVRCVTFSPDGKVIVSSDLDCTLHFWEISTGREIAKVSVGERDDPWRIAYCVFSPDGRLLAVATSNWNRGQKNGEIHLFDAQDKSAVAVLLEDHALPIKSVAFSPDGKMLAACSSDTIFLWDIVDERQAPPP